MSLSESALQKPVSIDIIDLCNIAVYHLRVPNLLYLLLGMACPPHSNQNIHEPLAVFSMEP